MVGAGISLLDMTQSPTENSIPSKAIWIKQKATQLIPEKNQLITSDYSTVSIKSIVINNKLY